MIGGSTRGLPLPKFPSLLAAVGLSERVRWVFGWQLGNLRWFWIIDYRTSILILSI